jgi:hypothetical protein
MPEIKEPHACQWRWRFCRRPSRPKTAQNGRILGPAPSISNGIQFSKSVADEFIQGDLRDLALVAEVRPGC